MVAMLITAGTLFAAVVHLMGAIMALTLGLRVTKSKLPSLILAYAVALIFVVAVFVADILQIISPFTTPGPTYTALGQILYLPPIILIPRFCDNLLQNLHRVEI